MYNIDPNLFMNWVVASILGLGVLLLVATLIGAALRRSGPLMSYLYMLSALFVCFGLVVTALGFRGQKSGNRPWHFFLDMKYQPKYTAQGESDFFPDGRAMRMPLENTVPFDGTDYSADAGFHSNPKADFLKDDARYYLGVANPSAKKAGPDGAELRDEPTWEGGKIQEGYYAAHIPERAIAEAGGWQPLIKRGQQQYTVHCAACHGASGRGGSGTEAYGIVGVYGLSVAPASLVTGPIRSQPDGQILYAITAGKGAMSAYGHQVKVPDRWAIVAYLRVLQYAHNPPGK